MFEELERVFARPRLFGFYTTETLWNDPHISEQMLAIHLDEKSKLASRPKAVIEASVDWMVSHFAVGPGKRVCDLGCGPGLYTLRFARAGATVTGVDFSGRSIAYARDAAAAEGLEIDYVVGNYLEVDPGGPFDLITLIFFDFCVLSPAQRKVLLERMRRMLADGGTILLDVVSRAYFATTVEGQSIELHPDGGFWAPGPHYVFRRSFRYEDEGVFLDKHVIVEKSRTREIYNWIQCHELDALRAEFAESGFTVAETYGNVAGMPYEDGATEYAVGVRRGA